MCIDSYSGSLSSSKTRDYFPCPPGLADSYDHMASSVLMQLPSATLQGVVLSPSDGGVHLADPDCGDYRRPRPPSNGFMGTFVCLSLSFACEFKKKNIIIYLFIY